MEKEAIRLEGLSKLTMLLNRRVIVGICGGIAAYKAVELVSCLQQAGALVDVIMSEHAEEFVQPLTFSTMSHRPVYHELWEPSGQAAEVHIALAEKAELLAIVPATANTIARLAHGIADTMLTTVALATRAPVLLAPAMHHNMYTHAATQANLDLLRARGVAVVEPEVGRLASGEIGIGRLPETATLLGAIKAELGKNGDLAGRLVVVTAGGTQEPIDPVRYIGNRSSGKMGYALASEARDRGAQVILISGPVALAAPYGVEVTRVQTALQMRDAVVAAIQKADVLVMSAAVADYRPFQAATQKLKKAGSADAQLYQMGDEFSLHLVRTPDILRELALMLDEQAGEPRLQRPLLRVGFAAETSNLVTYARAKLDAKNLDLLVANDVSRADSGFGSDTNQVLLFSKNGEMEKLPLLSKEEVAVQVWNRIVPMLPTT
jgi:phosphopantothenoylcysteine decarboxylase/phosphopantothenate--cysteine ligase